jgi:hypothetical protein
LPRSLWEDLCQHAGKVQSPEWHGATLEQREENPRVGEAEFSDWDAAKKRIRKECECFKEVAFVSILGDD